MLKLIATNFLVFILGTFSTVVSAQDSRLLRPDLLKNGRMIEPLNCSQLLEVEVNEIKNENSTRLRNAGLYLGSGAIIAVTVWPAFGAFFTVPAMEQAIRIVVGKVRIAKANKLHLIFEQAEQGEGEELMEFVNKIQKKNPELTTEVIISIIGLVNDSRNLCASGEIENARELREWILTPEYALTIIEDEDDQGAEPILDWSTYNLNQDIRHDLEILGQ